MNKPIIPGLSMLEICKLVSMGFGMIILNQGIRTRQSMVI